MGTASKAGVEAVQLLADVRETDGDSYKMMAS